MRKLLGRFIRWCLAAEPAVSLDPSDLDKHAAANK